MIRIIEWLEKHKSLKKVLKTAIVSGGIAFLTVVLNSQATIVTSMPEYAGMFVILFAMVNGLLNYLKHNIKV